MPGPGKSTDMALSISMGNMRTKKVPCAPKKYPGKVLFFKQFRTKKVPCAPKKYPGKVLFFKQFLCILRAVSLCVYTKSAHTQVFSGIFVRIFTRRKCRRVRHRAAASAVGSLCRGLREWEVSVLLHCHFTSLCRHKDKQVSDSFQGFRGICCSVFSHWRSIYSRWQLKCFIFSLLQRCCFLAFYGCSFCGRAGFTSNIASLAKQVLLN